MIIKKYKLIRICAIGGGGTYKNPKNPDLSKKVKAIIRCLVILGGIIISGIFSPEQVKLFCSVTDIVALLRTIFELIN